MEEWDGDEVKEKINRERERGSAKTIRDGRILKGRYNKRYRKISLNGRSLNYLKNENLKEIGVGNEVRTLIKLRCR